jgi:hypothetical protein
MTRQRVHLDERPLRVTQKSAHENKRTRNDLTGMQTQDRKNQARRALRRRPRKKNLRRNDDNVSLSTPKNQCVESKSCLWICRQCLWRNNFAICPSRDARG